MGAAKTGNKYELKNLYEKAEALNITNQVINVQDELGRSALHWAIRQKHIEIAKYIIQVGADVNTATNQYDVGFEGETPLIQASFRGYLSTVKLLIENGANIEARRKSGDHAASAAAENGNFEVLKFIIQKDPNVTELKGYQGQTPLIAAAITGNLVIVKYLISLPQTNIDSQDDYGHTSLMYAAYLNYLEIVMLLIENGADRSIKVIFIEHISKLLYYGYGKTALRFAELANNVDVIELLKENYTGPSSLSLYFACTFKGCDRSKYIEGQDWGHYLKGKGNCTSCMKMCLNDVNCGTMECQENSLTNNDGYCSWWSKDRCSTESELTGIDNGETKTCFRVG